MEKTYLFAGSGGQGVQTLGVLTAHASNEEGHYTTFLPAYGGEMRGGTSNCTIKISDEEIGSPDEKFYDNVIVLNKPSYDKFKGRVKKGGNLFVNTALIDDPQADEVNIIGIDLLDASKEAGSEKASNIIMYGLVLAYTEDVSVATAEKVLVDKLGKKEQFRAINKKAFDIGATKANSARKEEKK